MSSGVPGQLPTPHGTCVCGSGGEEGRETDEQWTHPLSVCLEQSGTLLITDDQTSEYDL